VVFGTYSGQVFYFLWPPEAKGGGGSRNHFFVDKSIKCGYNRIQLFTVLRRLHMQVQMQDVDNVAEKLNLSRDEVIRESLKFYLEKIIREIKTDIFKIRTKYGVSSIEDFDEKYKKGEIEEKDSWQEFQKLDHLEFKKEEMEKALALFK
jgi:hypothetical protein